MALRRHGPILRESVLVLGGVAAAVISALLLLGPVFGALFHQTRFTAKGDLAAAYRVALAEAAARPDKTFPSVARLERHLLAVRPGIVTAVAPGCNPAKSSELDGLVVIDSHSGPSRLILYARDNHRVVWRLEGSRYGSSVTKRSSCSPVPVTVPADPWWRAGPSWLVSDDGQAVAGWIGALTGIFLAAVALFVWLVRRTRKKQVTKPPSVVDSPVNGATDSQATGDAPVPVDESTTGAALGPTQERPRKGPPMGKP
jgi:hypothetical protein